MTDTPFVLTGIDGYNPLGFMTALGTLVAVRREFPDARLAWRRDLSWVPVLSGVPLADEECLAIHLAGEMKGRSASPDAEAALRTALSALKVARKATKKAKSTLDKRNLSDQERADVLDSLQREENRLRDEWLEARNRVVPRPELSLGERIKCTPAEFRSYASSFLSDSDWSSRDAVDMLAAFGSDACIESSDSVKRTPFCFINGAGNQYFLKTIFDLVGKVSPERVRSTLFEAWTYSDPKLSLRLDPLEDRRHALMDRDPSNGDARTVWMANLLAYMSLSLFASAPGAKGLLTTGWDGPGRTFTWPIWERPLNADTIRSLLSLSCLADPEPDRAMLTARGVTNAFRCRRKTGKNYTNFSSAQCI